MSEPFKFNREQCQAHLDKVIEFQNQFVGKRNHNPFLWIKKYVTPLYNRLVGINDKGEKVDPETTKELYDAIFKIPLDTPPIIDKSPKAEAKEIEQSKIVMTPAGMMLQDNRPQ